MGQGHGHSDKSDYWHRIEEAVTAYLADKAGQEVAIEDICRDVPEVPDATVVAMALAQLAHEGRVVREGKTIKVAQ